MNHFNHRRLAASVAAFLTLVYVVCAPALTRAAQAPPAPAAVNVGGEWTIYLGLRQPAMFRGTLVQEGTKLAGFMGNETAEYPLTGSVQADQMKFSWSIYEGGEKVVIAVTGKFDKEGITGTATIGELEDIEVTGQRTSKA